MSKKRGKRDSFVHSKHKNNETGKYFVLKQKLTLGQRAADKITRFGGSWTFIIIFFSLFISWMIINSILLIKRPFDPYPYILLNLVLSCLAAIQAPIILMSQNRQAERDRQRFEYDYHVNRKAEREIQLLQKDVHELNSSLKRKK